MIVRVLDPPSRHDAGFTLVEVLVVLALTSLLTGALFGSVRFGLQAWERTTSRSAAIDQNLLVQDFLRRTLSLVYPSYVIDDPTRGHVDFAGTKTSINFVGPTPLARDLGGRSRFIISLDRSGQLPVLAVSSQPELVAPESVSNVRDVLIANLSSVEFAYLGKNKLGQWQWQDTWKSEGVLPRLIRIRIHFPSGDQRVWPELLIAPRIDTDVSCVYDVLTKRCRGR